MSIFMSEMMDAVKGAVLITQAKSTFHGKCGALFTILITATSDIVSANAAKSRPRHPSKKSLKRGSLNLYTHNQKSKCVFSFSKSSDIIFRLSVN